jgi:hypothetical protein
LFQGHIAYCHLQIELAVVWIESKVQNVLGYGITKSIERDHVFFRLNVAACSCALGGDVINDRKLFR